ncbi:MAG: DUF3618 domain-containing protein [Actinobacteria bacterium]|nr:DUF3618 domain-containing protein [Actinomycetota bacterium]
MAQDPRRTAEEIEQTREELAVKVDELVDRAKVEAVQVGKKLAVVGAALVGVLVVGFIAKKRVQT